MDDIFAILEKAGWPAGVIGAAALLMYIADKLHLWERPARKSDRELRTLYTLHNKGCSV